jgi:hypothetical protein
MKSQSSPPGLTDWYPGDVKPVRDGVYQRHYYDAIIVYCHYKEGRWRHAGLSIEYASDKCNFDKISSNQKEKWRGLNEQPN